MTDQENIHVDILNSHQKSDIYHFKVMSLQSHEDTKDFSNCKLLFHFIFNLIKPKDNKYLSKFEWDINAEPIHRIYLSKDTKRLMEVINNFVAIVYYRVNVDDKLRSIYHKDHENDVQFEDEDNGQLVKWKVDFRIRRFPRSLMKNTSVPYIFSPNFNYQLDFIFGTR